ncbi:MAG TPA: N-acetylmuramoyl-L-alanine amidase [Rhizomicrobium sp.]|nr:N-acetylmuramoyl-L-alanine amidase [Rhizomicrobium sp.]
MAYRLIWLPEVLRGAGLKVAEVPGWTDRGHGEMGEPVGVICHHTGTAGALDKNMPTLRVLVEGRSDLSGPLAQLGLGRDGTFYVVAAGLCYHAGAGNWAQIASGNSRFIGIEAENGGTRNDAWPDEQMDAYRRGVAAIFRHIGAPSGMCCGHREFALPQGRKDDPLFDMQAFRSGVEAILRGRADIRPIIPARDQANRPTLRRGSRGAPVETVQSKLGVGPDGLFGAITEAAVRAFQRQRNAVPDGIVGPKTWTLLDAA